MNIKLPLLWAAALASATTPVAPILAQNWVRGAAPDAQWSALGSSSDGTKLVAGCWEGSNHGVLYTSTNSGFTWLSNGLPTTPVACVALASSGDGTKLVAGMQSDMLYSSTNQGATWVSSNLPPGTWGAVACSEDGNVFLAAQGYSPIYVSTNHGTTWTTNSVPSTNGLFWRAFASSADGSKLAAAGFPPAYPVSLVGGLIYTSSNYGATWSLTGAPYTNYTSIACSADGTKWIAGAYDSIFYPHFGALFISTDSAAMWRVVNAVETVFLSGWVSVACSADFTKLVAATSGFSYPGQIYISTNSGATWTSNSAPISQWGAIASSADGSKLAAAVNGGGIFTWRAQASLSIAQSGVDEVLSWPSWSAAEGFVLQQSYDLGPSDWSDVNSNAVLTNGQWQLRLSPSASKAFYRLRSP